MKLNNLPFWQVLRHQTLRTIRLTQPSSFSPKLSLHRIAMTVISSLSWHSLCVSQTLYQAGDKLYIIYFSQKPHKERFTIMKVVTDMENLLKVKELRSRRGNI